MKAVYDVCAEYAYQFGKKPGNLLLFGAPGLGKTHLSAAIARRSAARATLWCTTRRPMCSSS